MATYFTVAAINSLQLSCSFCRSVTLKSEGCMRYNHNHRSLVILFHWHIFPKLPPSLPSWPQKARQPISVAVQHGYHSAMWNVPASTGPKWWIPSLKCLLKPSECCQDSRVGNDQHQESLDHTTHQGIEGHHLKIWGTEHTCNCSTW